MAAAAVSDAEALAGFLDKWHAGWPEWRVAGVFVPREQRGVCVAWFALQQELAAAAWGGSDPTPGEAKLGWWAEELLGWSQGRRRHPLGLVLQRVAAPWSALAAALPSLIASREIVASRGQAADALAPLARALAAVDGGVFGLATDVDVATSVLMATQLLLRGEAAAPLQLRARMGGTAGEEVVARAWATDLLQAWPATPRGARAPRIHEALLRERLRRFVQGRSRQQPLPALATLRVAWSAARG